MEEVSSEAFMKGLEISKVTRFYDFSMITKHFHDSYEIYFLLEGERYYFIDKEIYHVPPGSLVLVNREQIHKTSMAENAYHSRILLQLDPKIFNPYLVNLGLPDPDELFSSRYGVIRLEDKDKIRVEALYQEVLKELQNKKDRYDIQVKLIVAELIVLICRYSRGDNILKDLEEKQTGKHNKVREVAEYLWDCCETDESLVQIASRFYISKSYLSRIFKEITGFTINEYINIARIKKAKHLLHHSEYTITEISFKIGYESITYFERVFKKFVGISPNQYRKSK
jgi:AraC-like DNA-binding protein